MYQMKKDKISIDIHKRTVREYVLEDVKRSISQEMEMEELHIMARSIGSVLKELWNNKRDSAYNKIMKLG